MAIENPFDEITDNPCSHLHLPYFRNAEQCPLFPFLSKSNNILPTYSFKRTIREEKKTSAHLGISVGFPSCPFPVSSCVSASFFRSMLTSNFIPTMSAGGGPLMLSPGAWCIIAASADIGRLKPGGCRFGLLLPFTDGLQRAYNRKWLSGENDKLTKIKKNNQST